MTPEQDKHLCEKYPKIFRGRNGSSTETCMTWGFECGSGWFDIIDVLCQEIQSHIDRKSIGLEEEDKQYLQVIASQVKEKYGELRFYYSGGDETIDDLVSMAEQLSLRTCETCGNPGKRHGEGWIITLCDPCAEERRTQKITQRYLK